MEEDLSKSLEVHATEQLPEFIYKYKPIDQYLYESIINGEIWFASPLEFNDPFDSNIIIDENTSEEQIKKYFEIVYEGKNNQEEIQNLFKEVVEKPDAFREVIHNDTKSLLLAQGVACFSRCNDNLLMWSHYADRHKGICLKFEVAKDREVFHPMFDVSYPRDYPLYDYLNHQEELVKIMKTKSADWQYEQEVRVIKPKRGVYKFKKEALSEVIFGCRASERQIETLTNLVKNNGYSNVTFTRTKMKPLQYGLDFEKIG